MIRPRCTLALPLAAASLLLPAAGALAASGPRISTMVVGKSRTLVTPRIVRASAVRLRASNGHRCAVAAGTPLAVLAASPVSFSLRDQGACSASVRDSSALYVPKIGPDLARGTDGWVYKVDGREGSTSAGDASGPFGTGRRLRNGQQLLWFWCRMGAKGCQRTLRVQVVEQAGSPYPTVDVAGLDGDGHAVKIGGAAVALDGHPVGTTNQYGAVSLPAGARGSVTATAKGLVPAFPVTVGAAR